MGAEFSIQMKVKKRVSCWRVNQGNKLRDREEQQQDERPQLPPQNETQEDRRYPARIRRPPDRY